MNISKARHTGINQRPLTAVELARIIKAAQPALRKDHVSGRVSGNRFDAVSRDPVPTYALDGNKVILKKNLAGALVDIRA